MNKLILFLSVLSALLYFGCYDQFGDSISQTGESDIYVAGKNATGFATYWNNGATINLTPSLPGAGIVNDIYISATNDVHIAGFHYEAGTAFSSSGYVTHSNKFPCKFVC